MEQEKTCTIVLGGKDFVIKPFTFRQVRNFVPAFIKFGGRISSYEACDELANAILAALSRDYPTIARSVLDDMETNPAELLAAADKLAEFTGLFKKKADGAEGEAKENPEQSISA